MNQAQVLEMAGWVVGRAEESFVALYSARPTFWAGEESPYQVSKATMATKVTKVTKATKATKVTKATKATKGTQQAPSKHNSGERPDRKRSAECLDLPRHRPKSKRWHLSRVR